MAFYNARWYDAQVGVFVRADTLVPSPGDPRTFNRYAYVSGNPLKFSDPSGHAQVCDDGGSSCAGTRTVVTSKVRNYHARSYAWAQASQAATRTGKTSKASKINLSTPQRVQQGKTVVPGGKYHHGLFAWGDLLLDIYVPPTVWFFPNSPGYHPIYRATTTSYVPTGSYRSEYSGGDDWPGVCPAKLQDPVIPGTWRTALQYTAEQMPRADQAFFGFFGSMNNGLESDPPSWDEPRAARGVDALQMLAYGSQGALNSFRYDNRFNLQVNAAGELRVIIMQRQYEAEQWFYVGFGIAKPLTPWHGGELKPR